MPKLTQKEFELRVKNINPDIEILGEYISQNNKVLSRCKKCGKEREILGKTLMSRKISKLYCGCKNEIDFKKYANKTNNKRTFNTKTFKKELNNISPNIMVLGEYKNIDTKIKCKCKICNNEWENTPYHLLKGQNCPKCHLTRTSKKLSKNTQQFIDEMKNIDSTIEILGEYINCRTNIKCKCKICNNEWEAMPFNLLRYKGCPKCELTHGEQRVANWLDKNNIKYDMQHKFDDCIDKRVLRFDFYIEDLNTAIEYDGKQHFEEVNFNQKLSDKQVMEAFESTQRRDKIKNEYCKSHNINLIRIPYWDYNKIEEILEKHLK